MLEEQFTEGQIQAPTTGTLSLYLSLLVCSVPNIKVSACCMLH